jgi:hypothetical protein
VKRLTATMGLAIAALTGALVRTRREYRMARCAHLAALRVGAQQLERAEQAEARAEQLRARLADWVAAATDDVNTPKRPRQETKR